MSTLVAALDHPAYHAAIKLRGYNGKVTVFQAVSNRDAAKVLRRLNPDWSAAQHAELAVRHSAEADRQRNEWSRLLDEASHATFGRPFHFTDYKVSAIGRDEFPEEHKERIRFAAHAASYHQLASSAHAAAAKRRH